MTKYICRIIVIVLLIGCGKMNAQHIGIGAFAGGGYISGDSPQIGSFTSSLFLDLDVGLFNSFYPRLSFIYAVDIDGVLPNTTNNYYPYLKGFSLKGIVNQKYEPNYFLEEGAGLIYLNDRTFSTTNLWNFGVVFSLTGGIDFADLYGNGFNVGIGAEYAFGFGGTFPKYFSIHLQSKYTF